MSISIEDAAAPLGAVIRGLRISDGLTQEEFAEIRRVIDQRAVVCIKEQSLSPSQQVKFSRMFGPPLPFDEKGAFRDSEFPELMVLSNIYEQGKPVGLVEAGQYWHTDLSFTPEPPAYAILQAVEVARDETGNSLGETLFSSSVHAYETLPDDIRKRILSLSAIHNANNKARSANRKEHAGEYDGGNGDMSQPVVRTHPRTKQKCLYVNETYASRLVGVEGDEGQALLDLLCKHVQRAPYVHKWEDGDLLVWDDCLVQHFATPNYGTRRRRMHRTSVAGAKPF